MSTSPNPEDKVVAQHSELIPVDKKDDRSGWIKFLDTIRMFVGMKPLYLLERVAEAKVRNLEVDVEAKEIANKKEFLDAKLKFEIVSSQIRKNDAETDQIRQNPEHVAKVDPEEIKKLKEFAENAAQQTKEEILGELEALITEIAIDGASVEIKAPEPDEFGKGVFDNE